MTTRTLSDITEAIVDCEHKTAPPGDGYGLSIGTRGIKNGRLVLSAAKPVSQTTFETWTRRMRPQAGDLILAREAPVGDVGRIVPGVRICLGQRTVLIRPDATKVDPRFLHYWLLGPDAQQWMSARAAGATVPHLNVEDIRALAIETMPRSRGQQERTSRLLGSIDDLIENNRRRIELLEQMAQAIYREWFVHFRYPGHENDELVDSPLGPIPSGWEAAPVGDSIETLGGGTPSKKQPSYWDPGTITWFTPTDLTRSKTMFVSASSQQISSEGLARSSAKLFPAGSIMMTSRATIGVVAISTQPACTNQGFITCIPNERVGQNYLYQWVLDHVADFQRLATGATFKEISRGVFRAYLFLKPSPSVTTAFETTVRPASALIANLIRQDDLLRKTRDLLLPKLVTGEIDVSTLDLEGVLEKAGV